MKRREFITLLGGAAATWPHSAKAQQPAIPVIGYLGTSSFELDRLQTDAVRQGLSDTGYVEGQNIAIQYRWAEHQNDRLPALAADLVRRQVALIALGGLPPALAAKAATSTIPIVFQMGVDPVEAGLVASLNRPGGNITGVSNLNVELGPKRLELVHELIPGRSSIALLVNPVNPNAEGLISQTGAAARTLGRNFHVVRASAPRELDAVFARLVELKTGALVIGTDGFLIRHGKLLGELSVRHRVPAIFQTPEFAASGGLMSYGASLPEAYRLVGVYAGRILKGEKPADLPVQRATKAELILNLKTAKALGLTIPLPLLGRADEVIE